MLVGRVRPAQGYAAWRLSARMDAVSLRDPNEFLLDVVRRVAERGTDPLDLLELVAFEGEAVGREGVLRVLDETAAELGVLNRAADDRADHFIAHLLPPVSGGARG